MRKFLSRAGAANYIGISVRHLDRYLSEGRIRAFKPFGGRKVLIHSDSITEENLKSPVPKFRNFKD